MFNFGRKVTVNRLPDHGSSPEEILAQLKEMMKKHKGAQMERFEKCVQAGLHHFPANCAAGHERVVFAHNVERLLAEGVTVYGCYRAYKSENIWSACQSTDDETIDTHQALLIGIKPIAKPVTADELLREFVDLCNKIEYKPNDYSRLDLSQLFTRVREYLGRKA